VRSLFAASGRAAALFAVLVVGAPRAASAQQPVRSPLPLPIAIDERLADDEHLTLGDRVVLAAEPDVAGDTAVVVAITRRGADPSQAVRHDYQIELHLTDLQRITGYGDRVDKFALATRGSGDDSALARINDVAFGFRAYRSAEIAVRTSKTFQVVSRFHRAIAGITIVASAIFLLCILLLKVDERRRDVAALRLMGISRRSVVTAVVIEAALISLVGSALGAVVGWLGSMVINWHYRGVYRTPLAFSIVTRSLVADAVILSIVLGVGVGLAAAMRLVRVPPLTLFGR
jgi:ABC-type lipoprotein release transport system permease subunit